MSATRSTQQSLAWSRWLSIHIALIAAVLIVTAITRFGYLSILVALAFWTGNLIHPEIDQKENESDFYGKFFKPMRLRHKARLPKDGVMPVRDFLLGFSRTALVSCLILGTVALVIWLSAIAMLKTGGYIIEFGYMVKGTVIRLTIPEDQQQISPEKYIWVDDEGNVYHYNDGSFFYCEDKGLSVCDQRYATALEECSRQVNLSACWDGVKQLLSKHDNTLLVGSALGGILALVATGFLSKILVVSIIFLGSLTYHNAPWHERWKRQLRQYELLNTVPSPPLPEEAYPEELDWPRFQNVYMPHEPLPFGRVRVYRDPSGKEYRTIERKADPNGPYINSRLIETVWYETDDWGAQIGSPHESSHISAWWAETAVEEYRSSD